MKKFNPHKSKFADYYMDLARLTAKQSEANKRKVGAVIVLPSGLIGLGWNGMPAGFNNQCEWGCEDAKGYETGKTKPEVIHAERNALDKLTREGVSPKGSILFVTTAPCIECAKSIAAVGIKKVIFDFKYKNDDGLTYLDKAGVDTCSFLYFKVMRTK